MPAATPQPQDVDHELRALLTLTLTAGLGPRRIRRLIDAMGSAQHAVDATADQLARVPSIGRATADKLANSLRTARQAAEEELSLAADLGVRLIGYDRTDYPAALVGDEHAPALLYVRGAPEVLQAQTIGIVGARRSSAYGLDQAQRFAAALAERGWSVVSGGARGIDTAAHRAALRVSGRTVAVLGCGLAIAYPPENAELFDTIVDSGGAVISELPLRRRPEANNFPARNRVIAGLSTGVLVVEAGTTSGALITARLAGELGRDVLAIPGRVDVDSSAGCHALIRDGAILVTHPEEAIEAMAPLASQSGRVRLAPAAQLGNALEDREIQPSGYATGNDRMPNSTEERILAALGSALTLDQLCEQVGLPPEQVRASVTLLEIRGGIRREGGRLIRRPGGM